MAIFVLTAGAISVKVAESPPLASVSGSRFRVYTRL